MRGGWTETRDKRTRRADVQDRVIVQADVVTLSDQVQRKDQWSDADSLTGFFVGNDGGLRLSGGSATAFTQTTSTTTAAIDIRYPNDGGTVPVAMFYWADDPFLLPSFTAHLDPSASADVDQWVAQIFQVSHYDPSPTSGEDFTRQFIATPISTKAYAAATAGGSASDITFNFDEGDEPLVPNPDLPAVENLDRRPAFFVVCYGIDSDGAVASDISWSVDGANSTQTTGNNELERINIVKVSGDPSGQETITSATGLPRITLNKASFSDTTVTFSTNPLDLGSTPTGTTRFSFLDTTPLGTSVDYEVRNDADTAWVSVVSGQTTDDLSGVGKNQTYSMRATLNTDTNQLRTPTVWRIAVEEVETVDFDDLAVVRMSTGWQIDPRSRKGSIPQAEIVVARDGRRDFRDKATSLVADNYVADIAFNVWWGTKDSDGRVDGLLIDTFDVDDYTTNQADITFICLGRNQRLKAALPVYKTSGPQRERLDYTTQTLKAVYDDILQSQLILNDRYIGPGVEDNTTTVTNRVEDSTAEEAMDAIAHLNGGGVTSSQGRITYLDMVNRVGGLSAVLPSDEVTLTHVGPGLRARTPDLYVPYDYDFETNRFDKEVRAVNSDAVASLGEAWVDRERLLDASVARWIDTEALAQTVGNQHVKTLGPGLMLWTLESIYPHPYLEPGDLVAVQTDQFAARDPSLAATAFRGQLWAVGRVQRVGDVEGRILGIWVQSYDDIQPTNTTADRVGYKTPLITAMAVSIDNSGNIQVEVAANRDTRTSAGAASIAVTVNVGSAPSDPTDATNDGEVQNARYGTVTTATTATAGDVVYAKAVAFDANGDAGTVASQTYTVGHEGGAEVNPPQLFELELTVSDRQSTTGDDSYTLNWSYTDAVDGTYDVDIEWYREGTEVGSTSATAATDGTETFSDGGAGDGVSDNHHARAFLKDSSGKLIQTIETDTVASTVL